MLKDFHYLYCGHEKNWWWTWLKKKGVQIIRKIKILDDKMNVYFKYSIVY